VLKIDCFGTNFSMKLTSFLPERQLLPSHICSLFSKFLDTSRHIRTVSFLLDFPSLVCDQCHVSYQQTHFLKIFVLLACMQWRLLLLVLLVIFF